MIKKYFIIKETSVLFLIIDKKFFENIDSLLINKKILHIFNKNNSLIYKYKFNINIEENIQTIVFSTDIKQCNIKLFKIL